MTEMTEKEEMGFWGSLHNFVRLIVSYRPVSYQSKVQLAKWLQVIEYKYHLHIALLVLDAGNQWSTCE